MHYAGFWKRLGAHMLDCLILIPFSVFILWVSSHSKTLQLVMLIPHTAMYAAYMIVMNAKYGGSLGKLMVGIRVRRTDGENIHWKEAILRHSIDALLGMSLAMVQVYTLFHITDPSYEGLTWFKKNVYLNRMVPSLYGWINGVYQVWIWGEFLTMLLNQRKRALHDFIAGTVVIDIRKVPYSSPDQKLDTILTTLKQNDIKSTFHR
ncbi:RDD family protein [Desulfoluna spongiiphila]|uniref:Uncharacterized membrane protein YckC, RDD family n=1 Tax=Desulfoluna spongiiphila TaxID=419481 RepID=A0A1G5BI50_9BACT|nr:RDD family protein [Desulfoluna spongiiphila]SCX89788.1 Uncharacterized membrane protein YckC, RDD family [Desulfoluna spongiiphila]VVS93751.1 rdd [Desulfoluna spongiiphila]